MKFTFLGTGDVKRVPVWGCQCAACNRAALLTNYARGPATAMVEVDDFRLLINAGHPDLSAQFVPRQLDGILLTHMQLEHVLGLLHMRWGEGEKLPVYGPRDLQCFTELVEQSGLLDFVALHKPFEPKTLVTKSLPLTVIPVPLNSIHRTWGYCIEYGQFHLAYLTQAKNLPRETLSFLSRWRPQIMVLDCPLPPKKYDPELDHTVENSLDDVVTLLNDYRTLSASSTACWLTQIGHHMDRYLMENADQLPMDIHVARDREKLDLNELLIWGKDIKFTG